MSSFIKAAASESRRAGVLSNRERLGMTALMLTIALTILDVAIANAALPSIAVDLHASGASSVWIVNAYQIAAVATLLPFASLGGVIGYRRVYVYGLVIFTIASAVCGLSDSLTMLTIARVIQGLGASAIMSVNTALIRTIYPPARLGSGLGLNALVVGASFAAGPSIASAILLFGSWPWLFAVNIPFGVLAFGVAWLALPESVGSGQRFEKAAAALNLIAFASLTLALCEIAQGGSLLISAPVLAVFVFTTWTIVRVESGNPAPMLPVDLLRRPMFALSTVTSVCAFATQGLAFVALPFYFQNTMGLDMVQTGALLTPWSVVVAMMAPVAGRLSDRISPATLGVVGLLILGTGLMSLDMLSAHASTVGVALRLCVCGLGFGLFQSPNQKAIMSSAPKERNSGASGVVAAARLIGQAGGAALVATCLHMSERNGPKFAFAVGAAFAVTAAIASASRLLAREGNGEAYK